jgi:peroxiredoxin
MIVMRKLLVLILLVLAGPALAAAPDLTLRDFNGKDRHASEFIGNGKWTVVVIWENDCPICNAEIQTMEFFHLDHKDKDAIVLGVSIDGWKKRHLAKDFVERHDLTFTNLLIELDMAELLKFGGGMFVGTPTFYIYDPSGEIVARQIGPLPIDALEKFISSGKG